jgi:hypothetical protein
MQNKTLSGTCDHLPNFIYPASGNHKNNEEVKTILAKMETSSGVVRAIFLKAKDTFLKVV